MIERPALKSRYKVFIHLVIWLVFLSIPTVFNPRRDSYLPIDFADDLMEPPRRANALFLLLVFYFNYYIAIPQFYFRKRLALLLLTVLASFGTFFLLNYLLFPPALRSIHHIVFIGNDYFFFMFLIVYVSSFMFCIYEQWQQMRFEKIDTELRALKAQINPHFLFNTLNSIYSLSLSRSANVADAILELSGIMRYSVGEANKPYVALRNEIEYISNYIKLQMLRMTEEMKVSFSVEGESGQLSIAPFLLIPFVENAFKYGVNSDNVSDLKIKLIITNGTIQLTVSNRKVFMRSDIDKGTGIGIDTTRQRLNHLYPDKYSLQIEDGGHEFNVTLTINLQ
jgi:hypothetical protein